MSLALLQLTILATQLLDIAAPGQVTTSAGFGLRPAHPAAQTPNRNPDPWRPVRCRAPCGALAPSTPDQYCRPQPCASDFPSQDHGPVSEVCVKAEIAQSAKGTPGRPMRPAQIGRASCRER